MPDALIDGTSICPLWSDLDPSAAAIMVIGTLTTFPRFEGPNAKAFDRIAAELWRAIINPGRDDPPGPQILPGT